MLQVFALKGIGEGIARPKVYRPTAHLIMGQIAGERRPTMTIYRQPLSSWERVFTIIYIPYGREREKREKEEKEKGTKKERIRQIKIGSITR